MPTNNTVYNNLTPVDPTPVDALRMIIEEELVELRPTDYVLTSLLAKRDHFQSQIRWNVNLSDDESTGSLVDADHNPASSDTVKLAYLPIGTFAFRETVSLLKTDIRQARAAGVGALRDLIAYSTKTKIEKMMKGLNKALYLGQGEAERGGVYGLDLVTNLDETYAGIDPLASGSETWVSPFESNPDVPEELTRAKLFDAERSLYEVGANYTHIVTTPAIIADYKQLFDDSHPYSVTADAASTIDLGFTSAFFSGRPIIMDYNCPPGHMYWMDLSGIQLHSYSFDGTTKVMDLNISIAPVSNRNSLSERFEIALLPQLCVRNRRSVSGIKNIA